MSFLSLIEVVGAHHIFTGPNKNGYGRIFIGTYKGQKKYRMPAHVYALYRLGIEIPDGKIVCHHCDVPPCVNPEHLYIGDRSTNSLDYYERLATDLKEEKRARNISLGWSNRSMVCKF